ncbi:MAG: hypothetical protein GY765_10470, partial [bacterium]|nr:hypothetical protein [bacterium]
TLELKKRFWRSLIGVPFAGDEQPITDEVLNLNAGAYRLSPSWPGQSFMGVDQGNDIHVAICHPEGFKLVPHWFEVVDDFDKLTPLMKKHNVRYAVTDGVPNTHDAKKFCLKHKKRAAVQFFSGTELREGVTLKGVEKVEKILMPRMETLADLVDLIIGGIIPLPALAAGPEINEVRKHLKRLVLEKVVAANGVITQRFKPNAGDHYAMALNNAKQAWYQHQKKNPYGSGLMPVFGEMNVTSH